VKSEKLLPRISTMSGLLSVLLVLAVVFVVRKLWNYISATSRNAPKMTEDAEAIALTGEVGILKAIRNGYRSGKNTESLLFLSFGKICNSIRSHNAWIIDIRP
jgi:hypothetical protein